MYLWTPILSYNHFDLHNVIFKNICEAMHKSLLITNAFAPIYTFGKMLILSILCMQRKFAGCVTPNKKSHLIKSIISFCESTRSVVFYFSKRKCFCYYISVCILFMQLQLTTHAILSWAYVTGRNYLMMSLNGIYSKALLQQTGLDQLGITLLDCHLVRRFEIEKKFLLLQSCKTP